MLNCFRYTLGTHLFVDFQIEGKLIMKKKEEFSIMNDNLPCWSNKRFDGSHRHEVFFGVKNRQKSIDDGLIVFLTYEMHEGTYGVHGKKGNNFDLYLKQEAEKRWLEYYNKSINDFVKKYGKNYL